MKTWSRTHEGVVIEVVRTALPIDDLYHPGLTWIEAPEDEAVRPGWQWDRAGLLCPPADRESDLNQ